MKYVLSYGGGINSSALFFYLLEKKLPLDLVIFADTGEDEPENYRSVDEMKSICKKKGILFVRVQSKHGNMYDYYYRNRVIMSMMKRDCTYKFKIIPIRKYLRETYGKKERFNIYIGIAWDEALRVRTSEVKYADNSYPFVDDKINRIGNLEIIKRYNFLAVKSGCKGCIYKKKKEWVKMIIHNPVEFERHLKLEENNKRYPDLLLKVSYSLRSLKRAYVNQRSLKDFEDAEPSCSAVGGCFS